MTVQGFGVRNLADTVLEYATHTLERICFENGFLEEVQSGIPNSCITRVNSIY